ncbi:MAG: GTPase Era [Deltaproteobacteria bacterium]|jgi:GTP-binding protein Era|nr:GTPase Era [Deltaproteobacteria bacterium]
MTISEQLDKAEDFAAEKLSETASRRADEPSSSVEEAPLTAGSEESPVVSSDVEKMPALNGELPGELHGERNGERPGERNGELNSERYGDEATADKTPASVEERKVLDSPEKSGADSSVEPESSSDSSAESADSSSSPSDAKGESRAGFVAIIGAPNAGKSSLLNRYLGQKVAIVARKPQTTRRRILGVLTEPEGQIIFWDTPGVHDSTKKLNKEMVAWAEAALADCDVCLWLVDGQSRGPAHETAMALIQKNRRQPVIAAINKTDLMSEADLKELSAEIEAKARPDAIVGVSALSGIGLSELKKILIRSLPLHPPLFDEDALTDQSLRAIAAEYVREAVIELTRQEMPYSAAVTIDEYVEPDLTAKKPVCRISATIHVEKDSQKLVMIGHKGSMLKRIGTKARLNLESFLEVAVFLSLFVRVTRNWSDNPKALEEFGYRADS